MLSVKISYFCKLYCIYIYIYIYIHKYWHIYLVIHMFSPRGEKQLGSEGGTSVLRGSLYTASLCSQVGSKCHDVRDCFVSLYPLQLDQFGQ